MYVQIHNNHIQIVPDVTDTHAILIFIISITICSQTSLFWLFPMIQCTHSMNSRQLVPKSKTLKIQPTKHQEPLFYIYLFIYYIICPIIYISQYISWIWQQIKYVLLIWIMFCYIQLSLMSTIDFYLFTPSFLFIFLLILLTHSYLFTPSLSLLVRVFLLLKINFRLRLSTNSTFLNVFLFLSLKFMLLFLSLIRLPFNS